MNGLEITLLTSLFYLSGILTGLGVCLKYKKHLLIKTSSQDQLSELLTSIHSEISPSTNPGPPTSAPVAFASAPPAFASAPVAQDLKEVIIRTS